MLCAVISTFLIYKIYKSISVDELVIEPPVYTNAGKWGPRRICKEGHFVVGMKLKIHRIELETNLCEVGSFTIAKKAPTRAFSYSKALC